MSADHPGVPFVEAAGYTTGRPDGPPLWIVIHDMESSERGSCAEDTANYFATGAGGRNVSSHYCVDNNSVVQCVLLRDSAWTVGNRPGNNRGINWELCGYASQSRAQWLDDFGLAMFAQIRPILRADAAEYGIPLTRRTVAELQAGKKGITSHNDLRLAFGGTTHTDPGSNFPWDVFLETMGDDVTGIGWANDNEKNADRQRLYGLVRNSNIDLKQNPPVPTETNQLATKLAEILTAVLAISVPEPAPVDLAAIRAIVREELDKTRLGT